MLMVTKLLRILIRIIVKVFGKNKLIVLTYHRVGDELFDNSKLNHSVFEQQLVWLKKYFNLVPLEEGLTLQKQRKLPNRAVSISVDDGYVDSFNIILPLLKKHNLSATFFISTSGLEHGILWDELISEVVLALPNEQSELEYQGEKYLINTLSLRFKCIDKIIQKVKYSTLEQRKILLSNLLSNTGNLNIENQFLTKIQIIELYKSGMGIGAHTVNHPILSCETNEVSLIEMLDSKKALEKIIKSPVNLFAYPNGKLDKDFTLEHQRIAEKCGYEAAFSSDAGCISYLEGDRFSLKRFTPWDTNEIKFILRLILNYGK